MDAFVSCPHCGTLATPEQIVSDYWVCSECGAALRGGGASCEPPPFDRSVYRYGVRLFGAGPLFAKLGSRIVRDSADRPLARVRARPSLRRFVALALGSVVLVAGLAACAWLTGELPESGLLTALVLVPATFLVLALSLSLVCLLSPGPHALVVATGRDPRVLLRVRPVAEGWSKSELAIEDANGVELGTIVLDRFQNAFLPFSGEGPLARIEPASAEARFEVRRRSRWTPGVVISGPDGVAATFGANPGLLGRDLLEVAEPPHADRRLFVAAMILVRP